MVTTLYIDFSDAQGQLTAKSAIGMWRQAEIHTLLLTQAFMVILANCKNEEDPCKNEGTRVVTTFLPL